MLCDTRFRVCNIVFSTQGYAKFFALLALIAALAFCQPAALAQTTTATLTGTVLDASGALVADATITLKNDVSGDTRSTVSNSEGFFVFAAVPPTSYSVTVEKAGFKNWQAKGIVLNAADKRNLIGITLMPGMKTETVVVEAADTSITPVDSGDKSSLITQHIIENVAIVGQNAAEFVKILPGMSFSAQGIANTPSFNSSDERTGTGPVGQFSANGTRTAALDITSDGAHIIDPGCNCGQAENTNADMTAELKVMTSNFGADEAKGPVTISVIGKSGGNQFHGEAYLYARHFSLNANDPQDKNGNIARPETKYWYPGAQISGPVLFPHSGFNRNRDKMFFFFATEAYRQDVDNGVYHAVVPTQAMRNGDFSDSAYIGALNGYAVTGRPNGGGANTGPAASNPRGAAQGPLFNNGVLDTNQICSGTWVYTDPTTLQQTTYPQCPIDPASFANGQILANLYPLPNQDPTKAGGFNYASGQTRMSNMLQFRGKVDYNFTQSTKLSVSYNHQHDDALNSLDVLWGSGGNSWAAPTTPYPSSIAEKSTSDVVSANLTKVFSPSLTNELVFAYTYLNLPNTFSDRSKVERGALGVNYSFLFDHPNPDNIIFPQMTGWGDGISNMLNTGFELNGTVYAKKTLPSVSDNLVKVWKTHTTKFGFYWERAWNEQPGNASVNGSMVFSNWGGGSTGNAYADMLVGQMTQYSEQNFDVVPAFRYIATEFYATDSWKVSRRVTLDYGMRFSHLGPWVDTTGFGFAAWYPDLYAAGQGGSVNGATFPGIEWNKVNSKTPLSGSGSRALFYNPRVGFAWDVFGTGKTVLRGGYGIYHFHDEQNVQNGAYGIVRGSFAAPTLSGIQISALGPSLAGLSTPSGVTALDPKDDQQPRTQSYSFTIAQRLPWRSQLEVAYVGSKSDYLSNWNNNFDQINDLPVGSLFTAYGWLPNCYPGGNPANDGGACSATGADTGFNGGQVTAARPLSYGTLKIIDHKMYSNYNGLQVTWNKQSGPLTFLTNYTYSKALGIRGEGGSATGDPTVLANNYGTLPLNRTHIFNLAYSYELPKFHSANQFVKHVANGWQISGIAQYQTGADLQASVSSNFNYTGFIQGGTTFMGRTITNTIQATANNVLGAADITLMPTLTCDPRSGLKSHQYINADCFSAFATPGQQGNYIFPTLTGPGFFNTDLSLFKNFTFGQSENKKLQFRFSGYNFLNHANRTFIGGDSGLNLTFKNDGSLANPNFGFANNTIGHRIIQLMVKFAF